MKNLFLIKKIYLVLFYKREKQAKKLELAQKVNEIFKNKEVDW